jgi:hypothetical protein
MTCYRGECEWEDLEKDFEREGEGGVWYRGKNGQGSEIVDGLNWFHYDAGVPLGLSQPLSDERWVGAGSAV